MATSLLAEITSAKSYFSSRGASGTASSKILDSFTASLIQQINTCMSMSTDDATRIQESLQTEDCPYTEDQVARIQTALDAKVSGNVASQPKLTDQMLKKWWHYCTKDEWEFFQDPKQPFHAKMVRLVERANLLGLAHPSPQCLKWMVAFLLHCHYTSEPPTHSQIFEKLKELKQVVSTERKVNFAAMAMASYPDSPEELDEQLYKFAYPTDAPVKAEVIGINALASKVCLRKNNSKLAAAVAVNTSPQPTAATATESLSVAPSSSGQQRAIKQEDHSIDLPRDEFEEQLYNQYKAALWQHRAETGGVLQRSVTPVSLSGTIKHQANVKLDPEARVLTIYPSRVKHELEAEGIGCGGSRPDVPPKAEIKTEAEPAGAPVKAEQSKSGAVKTDEDADSASEGLDDHAKAAIKALGTRNTKKKTGKGKAVPKEPGGVKRCAVKKPAEVVELSRADMLKSMPGEGQGPGHGRYYRGGAVYTNLVHLFQICQSNHD